MIYQLVVVSSVLSIISATLLAGNGAELSAQRETSSDLAEKSATTLSSTVYKKDWTGVYTTPVKDENDCAGSWAFAAVEQIESDAMRTISGFNQVLSTEQVLDCSKAGNGCSGGSLWDAFDYAGDGLLPESVYPFTAVVDEGSCKTSWSSDYVIKVHTTHEFGGWNAEQNMASHVQSTGPLAVCFVGPAGMNGFTGVVTNCGDTSGGPTICGQIVGVDTSANPPYWKVRGSFGTSWGDGGYIRLKYGVDMCLITDSPYYTDVRTA